MWSPFVEIRQRCQIRPAHFLGADVALCSLLSLLAQDVVLWLWSHFLGADVALCSLLSLLAQDVVPWLWSLARDVVPWLWSLARGLWSLVGDVVLWSLARDIVLWLLTLDVASSCKRSLRG